MGWWAHQWAYAARTRFHRPQERAASRIMRENKSYLMLAFWVSYDSGNFPFFLFFSFSGRAMESIYWNKNSKTNFSCLCTALGRSCCVCFGDEEIGILKIIPSLARARRHQWHKLRSKGGRTARREKGGCRKTHPYTLYVSDSASSATNKTTVCE